MFNWIITSLAIFCCLLLELQAQNSINSLPDYLNQKDFTIRTNLDYRKLVIHNIKTESLQSDSIQITIEASLLETENTNSLESISKNNIGIFLDSIFLGHPIELICTKVTKTEGIDIGLVADRSGSMSIALSEYDNQIRIDALKNSLNHFIENIDPKDSVFFYSFSNDVYLNQDWTNNINSLKIACNSVYPTCSTQLYGALLQAITKINRDNSRPKAIIALSDGVNNVYPDWSLALLHEIANGTKNVKIYVVALGLGSNPYDIDGRVKMNIIAELTGGKFFDAYTSTGLDSIYKELSSEIIFNKYCKIVFKAKACSLYSIRLIDLFVNSNNTSDYTYAAEIPFVDIFSNWGNSITEKPLRVRYCTSANNDDYYILKNILNGMGIEILERKDNNMLDLIELRTFANEKEANDFLKAFISNLDDIYKDKINPSKINTGIIYEQEESILPKFDINDPRIKMLFPMIRY
jgi:hypothetical protein